MVVLFCVTDRSVHVVKRVVQISKLRFVGSFINVNVSKVIQEGIVIGGCSLDRIGFSFSTSVMVEASVEAVSDPS